MVQTKKVGQLKSVHENDDMLYDSRGVTIVLKNYGSVKHLTLGCF